MNMPPPFGPPLSEPLKVLIVGAGIGGLSAAIALRRAGHNVELFEQSKFANEAGAAIHLGPNASRVLASYEYSEDRLGAVPCQFMDMLGPDGSVRHSMDQTSIPKVHGAPRNLCHRVDLHNELKHLAFDPEASPGPVCKLHLSHTVIGIDAEKGTLKIRGPWGPVVAHGDLIIGADGIHSIVRSIVFPESSPALPTGSSAFRFTIPVERFASDPELSRFVPVAGRFTMSIVVGEEKRIIIYPCRRGELLNFACIHSDTVRDGIESEEEWDVSSTVASLAAVYSDFDPVFLRIFGLLSDGDVKLWQLKDRGPIETWIRGNVCLLGDACHPMMPHLGQGGGQAIEDGAALGILFPLGIASVDVPGRLKLYEHVRKARAETIQAFSRDFMVGKEASTKISPAEGHGFIYGHDVVAYAKQSMTAVFIPRVEPPKVMQVPSRGPSRGPSPVPGFR